MSFGYQILGFGSGGGAAPLDVDYLVIAGGAAGTYGGGGAGGYRTSFPGGTKLTLNGGEAIPITVGGGGVVASPTSTARSGGDSTLATTASPISSSGGGGSCPAASTPQRCPAIQGQPGGSGGGGPGTIGGSAPGIGNLGGYTPSEGNDGGQGFGYSGQACSENGGGGGGAGGNGINGMGPYGAGGAGGVGAGVPTDFISPSYGTPGPSPTVRYFAAGGGGRTVGTAPGVPQGGYGGGGNGDRYGGGPGCGGASPSGPPYDATASTGSGSGGMDTPGALGADGIVLVNGPAGASFTVAPGTNTIVTNPDGTKTAVFTVSGTLQHG
jgi:hypothetical protein